MVWPENHGVWSFYIVGRTREDCELVFNTGTLRKEIMIKLKTYYSTLNMQYIWGGLRDLIGIQQWYPNSHTHMDRVHPNSRSPLSLVAYRDIEI